MSRFARGAQVHIGPSGAMQRGQTLVLLALVNGSRSYDDLIAATGLARGSVARALHALRAEGLATWEEGKHGTIRALVRESHEHLYASATMGAEKRSGPGGADTPPTLPNAPRRR